jgi:dTDP-4-dehydrorhamnose reductase
MASYHITFDENRFGFLFDLFKNLNISVKKIKEEEIVDEFVPRTTEQLEADLHSAMRSIKLHREGKIKLKDAREALNEL